MKIKTLAIAVAALGMTALSGYSQGQINFVNNSSALVTTNDGVGDTGAAALTTTSGIKVEVFYQLNTGGATPSAITSAGLGNWEVFTGSPLANISPLAGRFSGGTQTSGSDVYGSSDPTGNVFLDAVAWNGNAASFAAALAGGSSYIGYSAVWSQGTGNPNGTPATSAIQTTGFTGLVLTPVPEPTTIALGGLGAAALLLFRRKK
jgi:hypothetical protein